MPRNRDRVDLLSFNVDLGVVELEPCQPPKGLEFEAFLTDPMFRNVQIFRLKGIQGTGTFFQGKVGGLDFSVHQEAVRDLYRIDNFFLKRNYFVSEQTRMKAPTSETLDEEQIAFNPTKIDLGSTQSDYLSPGTFVHDRSGDLKKKSQVAWSDMEEDDAEDLFLDTSVASSQTGARKQTKARFLEEGFIDQLSTMGQRRVPADMYFRANPGLKRKDFYLFDYVALFVDFADIFEDRSDFKIPLVQSRLELLTSLEGTDLGNIPMQAVQNKGWSSSVKFLCQTLNGEYQISFLRVSLFFSVRKVASREKLRNAKLNEVTRSFLLGDKTSQRDLTKVIRLNLNALNANQKLLIDQDYVENSLSPVYRT